MNFTLQRDPTFALWAEQNPEIALFLQENLLDGLAEDHFSEKAKDALLKLLPPQSLNATVAERYGWSPGLAGLEDVLTHNGILFIPVLSVHDLVFETRNNLRIALPITDSERINGLRGRAEEFGAKIFPYRITSNWSFWQ